MPRIVWTPDEHPFHPAPYMVLNKPTKNIKIYRPSGAMAARCFPVAKVAGSSPAWVEIFAPFLSNYFSSNDL